MPWITDAQMAGPLEEADTHQTQDIRKFLAKGNEHHFILVASKGMGKTTLMRLKREQLQKHDEGVTLIPFNAETDIVSLPSSVDKSMLTSLQDERYWRALWETAIMISVILSTSISAEVAARQRATREVSTLDLPADVVEELQASLSKGEVFRRKPSEILDSLLQQSKSSFEAFRHKGLSQLTYIFRDVIASGCAVFIDSLDQELESQFPGDLDVWRTGQLGLMRAAWELNRQNRHVKVFVSIRQEAWASFIDPVKNNMAGSTLIIKYTDQDLRKIFELAIRKNDGSSSIEEFCGFSTIHNHFINQNEDVFEFIKRHTLGAPRWLVMLGSEIAHIRDARGVIVDPSHLESHQRAVADAVNTEAATLAKDYLKSEMRLFFRGSDPIDEAKLLLRPVQSTVLTLANITRLSARYQEAAGQRVAHPFCLLINLGLVGYSEINAVGHEPAIHFRMPYEFDWDYEDILPKANNTLYFLHPSLHQLARESSATFAFSPVRIGNKLRLSTDDVSRLNARRFSIFISYSSTDWLTVGPLVAALEDTFNETGEFADIWIDRNRMHGAETFLAQMTEGNRESDFMIYCASKSSVASEAVKHEITQRKEMDFRHKRKTLFTLIVDDLPIVDLPFGLSSDHVLRVHDLQFRVRGLAEQIAISHRRSAEAPTRSHESGALSGRN